MWPKTWPRRSACCAQAAAQGAKLAVLPENFALMAQKERDKRAIAETDGQGPVQDALAQSARELGITLVAGTFPIRVPGEERVAAASLVYGPDGAAHRPLRQDPSVRRECARRRGKSPRIRRHGAGAQQSAFSIPPPGASASPSATTCASRSCSAAWSMPARRPSWCPPPSPCPPARRTGTCCCARVPSRTCARWWPRPRWAPMPTAARPSATAPSSIAGDGCWRSCRQESAWRLAEVDFERQGRVRRRIPGT